MRVGDVLEILAALAFVAGSYLASARAWVAVLVVGACLAYFAQCWAKHELPKVKLPRPRLRLPRRSKS